MWKAAANAPGAILTIDASKEDAAAIIAEFTHGCGVDKAFECAGQAASLSQALKVVKPGGVVVCIGEQGEVPIHISDQLIRPDITLRGSWFYRFDEISDIVRLYERGLEAHRLITNTYPLSEAQVAFDRFFSGLEGKVILEPSAQVS